MRKIILTVLFFSLISLILMSACKKEEKKTEGSFTIQRYVLEPKPPVLKPGDFNELYFTPPKEGEKIIVEEDNQYESMKNRIMIYKSKKNTKDLLYTINPETNYFYIEKSKGNIYFTIEDGDLNNGLNNLWEIIVNKGIIRNTNIKIGDIFKFSPDGRYLCYVYNDYGKYFNMYAPANWAFIPVVRLRDLKSGKESIYDFSKTFLHEEWGSIVDITPEVDKFYIEFSMEESCLGKGYILLSDKKFYPTEE